jgi:hypothetical protein
MVGVAAKPQLVSSVSSTKIRYQTEILNVDLIAEAGEMMKMHREELCLHDDFELDPDWEFYFKASVMGMLVICTARQPNGKLIGYAAYQVTQNPHYREVKMAIQDVLFLTPGRRGMMAGYNLIKFADKHLATLGVNLVVHHVKVKFDFSPMLVRLGYQQSEKIFEKRLD